MQVIALKVKNKLYYKLCYAKNSTSGVITLPKQVYFVNFIIFVSNFVNACDPELFITLYGA